MNISIGEIFEVIPEVGGQYFNIYSRYQDIVSLDINAVEVPGGKCRLEISDMAIVKSKHTPLNKIKALTNLSKQVRGDRLLYTSMFYNSTDHLLRNLKNHINPDFTNQTDRKGYINTTVRVSNSEFQMSDEVLILLFYFYFSNVARYNPLHFDYLKNKNIWVLVSVLRSEGFIKFLKGMYGHIIKENIVVVTN